MTENISFHNEGVDPLLHDEQSIADWIELVASRHKYAIEEINYIFVSDSYLLEMNKEHLNHDTLTDILTFPLSDPQDKKIISDIYISVDRVKDNANTFQVSPIDELHRVIIHGLLHLCGFDDKTPELREIMEKEENIALSLRMF